MVLTREQQALNLGLSGIACSCAQSTVQPCETTMVRQQLTPKGVPVPSMASVVSSIVKVEGAAGLYRGVRCWQRRWSRQGWCRGMTGRLRALQLAYSRCR